MSIIRKMRIDTKCVRMAMLTVVLTAFASFALPPLLPSSSARIEELPDSSVSADTVVTHILDTLKTGSEIVKYLFVDTTEIIYVDGHSSSRRRLFWSGAVTGVEWFGKDESGLLTQEIENESDLPGEDGYLIVHYRTAPGWGKLRLCADDGSQLAINECRWGDKVKTSEVLVINEASRLTMADGVTWFAVEPTTSTHLSLRAPAVAAMIISVDGGIRDYEEFWNGLSYDIPLSKGRYVIGIKPLYDRPLAGTPLMVELVPIAAITGNDPLAVNLAPGRKRIFKFDLKSKESIGIAVSATGGRVKADVVDSRGNEILSDDERIFAELDKGRYYVILSAFDSVATDIRLRVFGLDNPPVDPPQDLLEWITKGTVGIRPGAGDERQRARSGRVVAASAVGSEIGSVKLDAAGKKTVAFGNSELTVNVDKSGVARVNTDARHRSVGDGWTRILTAESGSRETGVGLRGFMYIDRSAYSSKDSVFVKGYVRNILHGMIKLPPEEPSLSYVMRVLNPARTHTDYPVRLNELGGFDMMFTLRESFTIPGEYTLSLFAKSKTSVTEIARTGFTAAAYHSPRFEIGQFVPERVINNKPLEMRVDVSRYKSEKKAANRDVVLRVMSYRRNYRPRGFPGFVFSSDNRCFAGHSECLQGVFEMTAKTDEAGAANITLDPQSMTDGNPAEFIMEVVVMDTVKGIDPNAGTNAVTDIRIVSAAAQRAVTSLPPFALGVRANRHITSGSNITARVVAVGMNDTLISGQKVTASLGRITWRSRLADSDFLSGDPEYVTVETIDQVEEKEFLTKGNPVTVEFKNQKPGVYVLEISSLDDLGRAHTVNAHVFLVGNRPQIWKTSEPPALEIVTDRNVYEPGQQAKILVRCLRGNTQALAVIERPDGDLQYRWVNIKGGQGSFSQDIRQDMAPRLPVSVLLMPPPSAAKDKSEIVMKKISIPVIPVANMLDVRLSHAQTVAPGGTLDVTISVKDVQGRGRAGEVMLLLVDEVVSPYYRNETANADPLEAFIAKTDHAASPKVSGDIDARTGKAIAQKQKTYYRNMSIPVDRNGKATVKIPIPSVVGAYSIKAVAAGGPDRFGVAESKVSVR